MFQLEITCHNCKSPMSYLITDEAVPLRCTRCHTVLGTATPTAGYLYALRNDAMPGLLKVGFTGRSVQERLAELNSSTATPTPFQVVFFFACTDPQKDEALCHDALATYRLNEAREFFRVSESDALSILRRTLSRDQVFLNAGTKSPNPDQDFRPDFFLKDTEVEVEVLALRREWSTTGGASKGISLVYRLISEEKYATAKRVVELFLSDNPNHGVALRLLEKINKIMANLGWTRATQK